MSPLDFKSHKMNRQEARKKIHEIVNQYQERVRFSAHAITELGNDDLMIADAWNVLKSSDTKIYREGEWKWPSFRYCLESSFIAIVVAFHIDGKGFDVVTAWDKRKKGVLKK